MKSVDDAKRKRAQELADLSVSLHHEEKYEEADEALKESLELAPTLHHPKPEDYEFARELPGEASNSGDVALRNVLNFASESISDEGRRPFQYYYEMKLGSLELSGHRAPSQRLELMPFDMEGKTVLDIGCNFGGMLFANRDKVRWAVGAERDRRLVNAANRIAQRDAQSFRFYVFDIDNDPLDLVQDFLPEPKVDIVFFLAVCAHIIRWSEAIECFSKLAPAMLFEANGHEHEQLGQIRQLSRCFDDVVKLADRGEHGIGGRRLFFCSRRAA